MSHIWEDYSSLGLLIVSGLLAGGLGLASDELGQVSTTLEAGVHKILLIVSDICHTYVPRGVHWPDWPYLGTLPQGSQEGTRVLISNL